MVFWRLFNLCFKLVRLSKEKRQGGSLPEPINDSEIVDEDLYSELLADELRSLSEEICMEWKENDWIAVIFENKWYIRYIVKVS